MTATTTRRWSGLFWGKYINCAIPNRSPWGSKDPLRHELPDRISHRCNEGEVHSAPCSTCSSGCVCMRRCHHTSFGPSIIPQLRINKASTWRINHAPRPPKHGSAMIEIAVQRAISRSREEARSHSGSDKGGVTSGSEEGINTLPPTPGMNDRSLG